MFAIDLRMHGNNDECVCASSAQCHFGTATMMNATNMTMVHGEAPSQEKRLHLVGEARSDA